MVSQNPFDMFRQQCQTALEEAVVNILPQIKEPAITLKKTPGIEFGQLSASLCFELAKRVNGSPLDLAKTLVKAIDYAKFDLIEKITFAGAGYINFYLNFTKFSKLTLESIKVLNQDYGFVKTSEPKKIIVEHTSVNPLHPIHIGQARNPILGDALARILVCRGHKVSRHYYIDDVGRQSSVLAYGFDKLGRPKPTEKSDLFVGKIYTVTSCIVELNRLKKVRERIVESDLVEDLVKVNKEIDEWMSIAGELKEKYPVLFDALISKIVQDEDPEGEISRLNLAYENGQPIAKQLIREVSDMCLEGFRQTMKRVLITYDSWDWESDFVWSLQVNDVLEKLKESPFVIDEKGVLQFDADKAADVLNLKGKLGISSTNDIPPLTLVRGDGTTLYTTRDIAYTIWKFTHAQKVINVIDGIIFWYILYSNIAI